MTRGTLRIFLGAVTGVGKSYAMLNEGRRRHERGADVVVGFVDTRGRHETAAQLSRLEIVPPARVVYRGESHDEMDVDAVLERRPAVCLVDDIAHANTPGSANLKRWQDVDELLEAGIDVLATLNVQHLESMADLVERITGVPEHERIPDDFVQSADEVQLVEITSEALRRRLSRGELYAADRIDARIASLFRTERLDALRELALLWVADRVDERRHTLPIRGDAPQPWETRERVLVVLTGRASGEHTLRRAARLAQRARAELIGVHVVSRRELAEDLPPEVDRQRALLEALGGRFREIAGEDVAATLAAAARDERATQLVLDASRAAWWRQLLHGSEVSRVLRLTAGSVDIHIVSPHDPTTDLGPVSPQRRGHRTSSLPVRRVALGGVVGVLGLTAVTLTTVVDPALRLSTVLLLYLSVTVGAAAIGGRWPGLVTAATGFLLGNYHYTEPFGTLTVDEPDLLVALVVFLVIAAVVAELVDAAVRRQLEAARARAEASALTRLATALLTSSDPLPELVADLRRTFGLHAVGVLRQDGDTWVPEASDGSPCPARPRDADDVIQLDDRRVLVLRGSRTPSGDRRLLSSFAAQLAVAAENRELHHRMAKAADDVQTERLRTALLQSVSHDLRTPLAGITASATSLLQDDVAFSEDDTRAFITAIVEESDRLDRLVTNLLDMSRVQGGLRVRPRPINLVDTVAVAIGRREGLTLDVPDDIDVTGDEILLERVIVNLVDNAGRYAGTPARIAASVHGERVQLRVVDTGPGIPPQDRERVFSPFERGSGALPGVGLGLAVSRGFVEAMGGTLSVEETPGGGTTMVVELGRADQVPT